MAFLVGGANSAADTGYDIDNSCRFDEASDASLGGTFGTPTEAKAFTLSMWFKRAGMMGTIQTLLGPGSLEGITLWSDEKMTMYWDNGNGGFINWAPLLRDHSAWYHFVIAQDTAQGTDTNRVKFYLNGTQITTLSNQTSWPAQDLVGGFNEDGQAFYISTYNASARPVGGYCAEVAFIDGLQYAASNFGETDEDSGIWKPKEFKDDVTFGNNGFYLEFKQSGVGTNASGLGADTSGNDNHLAVSNLAAIDQCTDTPTKNWATFNPLMYYPAIVSGTITVLAFSEGNTKVTGSGSGTTFTPAIGSIGVSSGKWYYEFYTSTDDSGTKVGGAMDNDFIANGDKDIHEAFYGVRASNGTFYYNDSTNESLSNATEWKDNGDILSVALNLDDMEISFSTNGASYTAAQSITGNTATSGTLHPAIYLADDEIVTVNFGNPSFAISSGNADANGYGNFEYAPPNGYYALCTKNLAEYG